jgi:cytoskeletal protein CcmA (bactofilin family)
MSIFSNNRDNSNLNTAIGSGNTGAAQGAQPGNGYVAPAHNNPSAQPTPSSGAATSIAEGTVIEGTIKVEGDIRIDGRVKGFVTSKSKVTLGPTGYVEGDILCRNADISGRVNGKLEIQDLLYLKGNAVVDGDIHTGKLVIEAGVKFNGKCSMGTPAPIKRDNATTGTTSSGASTSATTAPATNNNTTEKAGV